MVPGWGRRREARTALPDGLPLSGRRAGHGARGPGRQRGALLLRRRGHGRGRVNGRLQAANHPRSRVDKNALPDVQGAIETEDGATIIVDYRGFARPYPPEGRQIVIAATHVCGHERYSWLNDVVCVGTGEFRPRDGGSVEARAVVGAAVDFVIDVAELIWEPIP